MPKHTKKASLEPAAIQLSLPLWPKPFLDTKKKIRNKYAREAFDLIEQAHKMLQTTIERDEIHSREAKYAIQQFLHYLK